MLCILLLLPPPPVISIALRVCIGCSQAHAAEADADLTKITSKVFFDIQIDGKPEGLFAHAKLQIRGGPSEAEICQP
jgi:hypothetical protein